MTLSRATDWILVVGRWPVLDLWLKPPRSYGPVIDTQIRTHTVKAAHKLVRRFFEGQTVLGTTTALKTDCDPVLRH